MVRWDPSPLKLHALTTGQSGTVALNFHIAPLPNVLYRVIAINVDISTKFHQCQLDAQYDDGTWYNLFTDYITVGARAWNNRIDIDGDKLTTPPNLRIRIPNVATTDLIRAEIDLLVGIRE